MIVITRINTLVLERFAQRTNGMETILGGVVISVITNRLAQVIQIPGAGIGARGERSFF